MKRPVMDLCIRTTANEIISLVPGFLAGSFTSSITQSEKWHAQGGYGNILIEKFRVGLCTIRLLTIQAEKKLSLTFSTAAPVICARVVTGSSLHFSLGGIPKIKMHKGQYTIYRLNSNKEKIILEKGKEYQSFDVIYPLVKLEEMQHIFPEFEAYLETTTNGSTVYLKKPVRVSAEMMDIVRDITECAFGDTLREFYLKNKLDLLLFLMMTLGFKNKPEEDEPTEAEVKAVHAAEKIILTDITIHHPIPMIAVRVKLNECRLKYVFKNIYKMGLFEYLVQARMEAAKRMLIQTDLSITEITTRTGYQTQTNFTAAFKRHFGYTPGAVRRGIVPLSITD